MKFKFLVTESANFYSFLDNITNWNSRYNMKTYRDALCVSFPPDKKTSRGLFEIKEVFQNIALQNPKLISQLRLEFYRIRRGIDLKNIMKILGPVYGRKFLLSCRQVEEYWDMIWNCFSQQLTKNASVLHRSAREKRNREIVRLLTNFFNCHPPKEVRIYLLLNPNADWRFGRKYPEGDIALGISQLMSGDTEAKNKAWLLIWHEFIHLLQEEESGLYKKIIKTFFSKNSLQNTFAQKLKQEYVIKELIADAFAPRGYLAKRFYKPIYKLSQENKTTRKSYVKKLYGNKVNVESFQILRREVGVKMLPVVEKYLKEGRVFDLNFILSISHIIE